MLLELTEEVTNISFVQGCVIMQKGSQTCTSIEASQNLLLVGQRNLRIGNQNNGHECMSPLALAASDPLNFKRNTIRIDFQISHIGAVINQGTFTSTGTYQGEDVYAGDDIFIDFLGEGIAKSRINSYHSRVAWR